MFFKKLNNAALWEKIQKLRRIIKSEDNFKERTCWKCDKELNIYDFLSDNLEYTAKNIISLWQNPILEFHCCACFKDLKIREIESIERELKNRHCADCNIPIDIYKFSKMFVSSKIDELRELWLNTNKKIFCSKFCRTHYIKIRSVN